MSEPTSSAPVTGAPVRQRENPPHKPRSGKGWIWLLAIVVVAAAGYYFYSRSSGKPGTAPAPAAAAGGAAGGARRGPGTIPVVAARSKKGDISVYLEALGNVTPLNTVTIKSRVDGQLMEVKYKEGDIVKQGAPLVEIDTRPYQVALEQAQGQLARDQALLDNANVDLSRYAGLLKQNAIPEQQYATQKALVAQDEGVVKSDQGQINAAKLNLTYCHIASPITGRVGLRLVDAGNIVHASDSTGLLVITQVQPISVVFAVPEEALKSVLPRYRAGQRLPVEAWDRDAGTFSDQKKKIATGSLYTIDNEIDQTTGTLRLRAVFANANDGLFPNQFVNVRLLVEQKRGVVLIPNGALQITTDNKFVYLVKPDSTVTVRNIVAGTTEGDQTEVLSGLNPGDVLVMQGVDKLNEGSKVIATIPGEQPAGGRGGAGKAGRGTAQ
jgi:multidrug efflux system membrane fusion protein